MIYPYQADVYKGLQKAMAIHHYAKGLTLPVKPRTHTLVIGPTGTGKTHLANEVLKELNWGCYHINCSAWMVMGSRGDSHTLPELIEWVANSHPDRPLGIVLDEIDKVDSMTSDWYRNVRSEMFSLLDGHIPPGTYDLGGVDGSEVERRFKSMFIVGCGAFQDLEDAPQLGMGFNPEDKTARGLNHLSKSLSRELVNRFSDKVLRLPKLGIDDYREITKVLYRASDAKTRLIIKDIANSRVESAVENQTGARFGEVFAVDIIERVIEETVAPHWVDTSPVVEDDLDPSDELWGDPIPG